MTTERAARTILARNGATDPHPDLLADTIREVEYHGIPDRLDADAPAEWTIARQETEVECSSWACDLMHRHLYNTDRDRALIEVYGLRGDLVGHRWESRMHLVARVQWAVVDPAGFAVETFDTRREARQHFPRLSAGTNP